MRMQSSLAGNWAFQLDPEGTLQVSSLKPDREIPVPMPWQAVFPDLQRYSGYAWYQRTFEIDSDWLAGELLLEFGAVDYWCQVYVNDCLVGEHEGGYTPFRLPIRSFVHAGQNTLSVRVYDAAQEAITVPRWRDRNGGTHGQPPFEPELIPHGKQTWYIDASGIWQDVTLTAVPAQYIDRVHVTPDIHSGGVRVAVRLAGMPAGGTLRATIDGQSAETSIQPGQTDAALAIQVPQPALWTPEMPRLYTVSVDLESASGQDQAAVTFGFREITTRDGYLLLNGEPLYLLCALDQDFYPDTIYTVPSDDFLRDQFSKAKELGLNCLRCHIKVPDPRYLELADEMGLLVWAEIPSWRTFYPKTSIPPEALRLDDRMKTRVRDTLAAMIERDYNHPSIIIWTIVNEDWGTALLLSEADRQWVAEMFDYGKQLDPTRLIVDNSPCPASWGLSVHVKSDLDDFHIYTNIPESARLFEQFVDGFGLRPGWSFSLYGDAQRTGREPLVISEFGNWGMPSVQRYAAGEPDWFRLLGWWSSFEGEPGYAAGVLQRFEQLGLRAIWPDYEAFAQATQWHAYEALKFEIEAMRRQPGIQGYVITELSDIYWESNGLLDFARGPKVFHQQFASVNTPDLVIPKLKHFAYWDDQAATVGLFASHYSSADWSAITARAVTAQGEEIFSETLAPLARGEVRRLGTVRWPMSPTETAARTTLALTLENGSGDAVSQNEAAVLVVPGGWRQAAYGGEVAAIMRLEQMGEAADIPSLRMVLQALGYRATPALTATTDLLITDQVTAEQLAWVRAGGTMLFLSSEGYGNPFFWQHPRGGVYGGNWISSFDWLRRECYRRLPVSSPLGLPFLDLVPGSVILGLPLQDAVVQQDILAGQISGWVHHPAAHTVQFRYGKGRVMMTTYCIRDTITYQPLATLMLHDLVDHLMSDACQPLLKVDVL